MPRYLVFRALGDVTDEQLDAAAETSRRVRAEQFPEIEWEHSHVVRTLTAGARPTASTSLRRRITSAITRPPPACLPTTCWRSSGTCFLDAMLDHVGFGVTDYDRSKAFYEQALAPLGIDLLLEPVPGVGGFGAGKRPFFWIDTRKSPAHDAVHVAFATDERATVDAFHAAALAAGGTDNGAPGRPRDLPPELLRRLRARPRRQQHRGRLPPSGAGRIVLVREHA